MTQRSINARWNFFTVDQEAQRIDRKAWIQQITGTISAIAAANFYHTLSERRHLRRTGRESLIDLNDGEYETILSVIKTGGFYTIEIDADDIPLSAEDEKISYIAEKLTTGFEHAPSSIVQDPKIATEIIGHLKTWGRIQVLVANAGGKIIYRKLPNDRFEAMITGKKE